MDGWHQRSKPRLAAGGMRAYPAVVPPAVPFRLRTKPFLGALPSPLRNVSTACARLPQAVQGIAAAQASGMRLALRAAVASERPTERIAHARTHARTHAHTYAFGPSCFRGRHTPRGPSIARRPLPARVSECSAARGSAVTAHPSLVVEAWLTPGVKASLPRRPCVVARKVCAGACVHICA